jgi:hypothetical protein
MTALLGAAALFVASTSHTESECSVSLFSISKTENRNYVQYAVRLDAHCDPVEGAPVYAYWRMVEHGPQVVEPLLPLEQRAYGIASQSVLERSEGHSLVKVTLRALAKAPLLVEAERNEGGQCAAYARMPIDGVEARLRNVHAVLRWPFGVARLLVSGSSVADGRPVRESRNP